jgi:divalent metal cation (Fe/Co/Zn/Cd) transporter
MALMDGTVGVTTRPIILPHLGASSVIAMGAAANVVLAVLKFAVGTLGGSAALIADATHSASDLLVDAVCMLGTTAPAFERVCLLIVAALLSSAGTAMIWSSCSAILAWEAVAAVPAALNVLPFLVALAAIGTKESLFRVTRQVGVRDRSAVLMASAKHHRSDAMSSIAAAIGTCGSLVGLPMAETLAAAVVGGMMLKMGVSVAHGDDH